MLTAGLIVAGLAALLHVYIFVMESLTWTSPRTRATFGLTEQQAADTKELAFNQGFYNLFLAVTAFAGIVTVAWPAVSTTLLVVSLGSMLGAAVVLLISDRSKARAALVQGGAPLIGLVALGLAAIS